MTRQLRQQPQEGVSQSNNNNSSSKSHDDTTAMLSQGGTSEQTTSASLHLHGVQYQSFTTIFSNVIDTNTHENSMPFMHVTSVAPRASLDTSRYSKPNVFSPPIPPPKMATTAATPTGNTTSQPHPLPPPPTTAPSATNTSSGIGRTAYLGGPGPSAVSSRKQQQQQQHSPSLIPPFSSPSTSATTSTTTPASPDSTQSPSSSPPQLLLQQSPRRYHIIPGKSALTAMIAAKASTAENPFSTYSHASGKGSSQPMTLCVYLPHSSTPYEPVSLVVRPDAIIDDVIGYILYDYVEQKRKPELDQDVYDLAQWVLLIAEDDGEIEDDLPALDRTRKIDKVSFDQFALCRANPSQAKQNEQIRAKLGRFKPDLDSLKKKPSMLLGSAMNGATSTPMTATSSSTTAMTNGIENNNNALHVPVMTKGASGSTNYSGSSSSEANIEPPSNNQLLHLPSTQPMETSSSAGGGSSASMTGPTSMMTVAQSAAAAAAADADSSSIAVPVPSSKSVLTRAALPMTPIKYFKIHLMTSEEVSATTTIPVYAEMFIGDVLELVSRKRKLDPNEYMLTFPDSNMVISSDTAVASLKEDVEELALKKKGTTLTVPNSSSNPLWRSPIKKRKEDPHSPMYFNTGDSNKQPSDNFLQQYKKYNVNRKTPMFVGKRVSVLAIDGNYIHLMPPEHKGMFDSVKTSSFQISAIRLCKQSKKVPSNFKIGVMKERDYKTYDLEAETSKEAYEICARIRFLMQMNKGSGT
ncbi:unnamed protein product [Absidia cylindrospora]